MRKASIHSSDSRPDQSQSSTGSAFLAGINCRIFGPVLDSTVSAQDP